MLPGWKRARERAREAKLRKIINLIRDPDG